MGSPIPVIADNRPKEHSIQGGGSISVQREEHAFGGATLYPRDMASCCTSRFALT